MAVQVISREFDAIIYTSANKWVIDDERQLHIVGQNGNLASYATGHWASVQQFNDPEELPTAA